MEKTKISVITTLYNGNGYLPRLIGMFRQNVSRLGETADVEYLLVNDSPWTPVDLHDIDCTGLQIRVLENPENYGIHRSRAEAVQASVGEFILILDQDDEISENYLLSQLRAMGDSPAVVCNGIKEMDVGSKKIYRDKCKMSLINRKWPYLLAANQIVSPGQCLLRKSAIPVAWLENPQKVNGSDDLFLWLLMLSGGARFAKNPAVLYTHKQVGDNPSNSLEKMCLSDAEMCEIMSRKQLLPKKDISKRQRMCAYLKRNGYRNFGSLEAMLRYPDVVMAKIIARYI